MDKIDVSRTWMFPKSAVSFKFEVQCFGNLTSLARLFYGEFEAVMNEIRFF